MDLPPLPTILEIKRTMAGGRKEFRCHLVEGTPDSAVVLFVSTSPYQVATLALPAGTVTLGHFWQSREYNVYHWMTPAGVTLAHYFNLAAETSIAEGVLGWTDLALDLLVLPGQPAVWLDEAELPADLPADLAARIHSARAVVLREHPLVIADVEARADALWPRLFGRSRR